MVERFNGRISGIVNQTRFGSAAELESTLRNYVGSTTTAFRNARSTQNTRSGAQEWHEKRPELFRKRVYNQRVLTYRLMS